MVGYASDETARLHRLTKKTQSILYTLGITEQECFKICEDYGLLSPLYGLGFKRDGCWFCPNNTRFEREYLIKNYPELIENIIWIMQLTDFSEKAPCYRNNWAKWYYETYLEDTPTTPLIADLTNETNTNDKLYKKEFLVEESKRKQK